MLPVSAENVIGSHKKKIKMPFTVAYIFLYQGKEVGGTTVTREAGNPAGRSGKGCGPEINPWLHKQAQADVPKTGQMLIISAWGAGRRGQLYGQAKRCVSHCVC
jgi:hypothetical protein